MIKETNNTFTIEKNSVPVTFQVFMKSLDIEDQRIVVGNMTMIEGMRDMDINIHVIKDSLTGAFTRTYFNYVLASREAMATENDIYALAYFDIKDFHKMNENLGITMGDLVLKAFFRVIQDVMPKNGIIARNGADQALVLLEGGSSKDEIMVMVDKINAHFQEEIFINTHKVKIHFAAGITTFPDLLTDIGELILSAEIALNSSKKLKQSNICFYDKEHHDSVKKSDEIYKALNNAIENKELSIYFQPLYDGSVNKHYGTEILLRWESQKLGKVPPSIFIPLAEQSDLIVEIGNWVIQETLKQINKWKGHFPDNFMYSINVSPIQIRESDFEHNLVKCIQQHNVSFSQIQIELTESVFVEDYAATCKKLDYLRSFGIKVAMDDFGTGYSSLNYLRNLPLDVLKIDKLFTDQICMSYKEKAIARAIVELANVLELDVIAEGVETTEQFDELRDIGCNRIQGYLFGKPVDHKTFMSEFLGQSIISDRNGLEEKWVN